MNRIASVAAATLLLFALAGVASAHTGGIEATQKCDAGNVITAHLNDDVAADSTWTVTANGEPLDQGTGPGPRDLGPYAFKGEGTATLSITFGEETYTASTELRATVDCQRSTPPSRPPHRTIPPAPPSDVAAAPVAVGTPVGTVLVALGGVALGALLVRRRRA